MNNSQLVVVAESGHTGFYAQKEAFARLVTSFYDTGVGDGSRFEYRPMDFSVPVSFPALARQMVRRFVIYPLLTLVVLAVAIGGGCVGAADEERCA